MSTLLENKGFVQR